MYVTVDNEVLTCYIYCKLACAKAKSSRVCSLELSSCAKPSSATSSRAKKR